MAGKIFSSRNELSTDDALRHLLKLIHEMTGLPTVKSPPTMGTADLLLEVNTAVFQLCEQNVELNRAFNKVMIDAINFAVANSELSQKLLVREKFLDALAQPPNGEPLEKALLSMKREGDPEVSTTSLDPNDPTEIQVDVKLTFTEKSLAEALELAIYVYNFETVDRVTL